MKYLFPLILIVVLVYLNSLGNAFVWDDLNNIVDNERLEGPVRWGDVFLKLQSPSRFYRPIPFLTVYIDHIIWKENPLGYHFTNTVFHLFNVILIFYLVQMITKSNIASFISALLFAVHPVHTEAVSYISGRSDPICAFFLFGSFYFYLRQLSAVMYKRFIFSATALSLFLFALFSKEIALIFPLVIFSYDICFLNGPLKFRLKRNMPFVLLTAGFLLFRHFFVKWQMAGLTLGKLYLLPKISLFYMRLLVFPFDLHMQHSLTESDFLLRVPLFLSAIIFVGIILVLIRHAKNREIAFGASWFMIGLLPFLGILKLNADMAEHWLYFPSFGFFLVASSFLVRGNLLKKKIVLSIVVLLLVILTVQRNYIWRDDISIYQDTLKYRPSDPKLHYNLGNAYFRKGLLNEAHEEYSIALDINPDYGYALNNLGLVLEKQGKPKAAYQLYEKAHNLNPELSVAKKNKFRIKLTTFAPFTALAFAEELHFDHSLYGEVLSEFTKSGNVNYSALKDDRLALDIYLKRIAKFNPEELDSMSRDESIAFYINVYNALTLKVILDNYPVNSIKDIPGVWDKIKFEVAQRELTLNQIEHSILRKEFKEPRIHFALVCASKSCPKLTTEPFNGRSLDEQLEREARKFINDKTKVKLDKNNKVLYISSIFKWFKTDFGDVIKFITQYLSEDEAAFVRRSKPRIKYLKYDWSLNEDIN